jgi:RNA 2',3'-cyclic 3'-phosphodiesterase
MRRIFAAIKISPDTELISFLNSAKLKLKGEKIKWVPDDNIHITLKFFGNTEEEKIQEISAIFHNLASQTLPFDLCLGNLGCFGSKFNHKVLWIIIKNNERLKSLVNTINLGLQTLGYMPDNKNLNSHLTIARMKKISDQLNFRQVVDDDYKLDQIYHIDHFTLFESVLTGTGAIYSEIDNFYFGK